MLFSRLPDEFIFIGIGFKLCSVDKDFRYVNVIFSNTAVPYIFEIVIFVLLFELALIVF